MSIAGRRLGVRKLAPLLAVVAVLGCGCYGYAEEIAVDPPRSVCATVSKVTLEGGASYNTVTRDWEIVVQIEIVPPTLPTVVGVDIEPMQTFSRRAVVTARRAEIEALAGKSTLTETELSAAVRGVVLGKLQALLAGMGSP